MPASLYMKNRGSSGSNQDTQEMRLEFCDAERSWKGVTHTLPELNNENGIAYHYKNQLTGDYDKGQTEGEIIEIIKYGMRGA